MTCKNCNHNLPDDSEFCQYCGSKIETSKTSPDDAISAILKFQAAATVNAMQANSASQPNNEDLDDFGLVPEMPIYTHALKSVLGEEEYLDRLYTENGEKIKYTRRGSTSVDGIHGMIDIYDTFLPSGQPYKTIYINMYGAKASTAVPRGFTFSSKQRPLKPVKTSTPQNSRTPDSPTPAPPSKFFAFFGKHKKIFLIALIVCFSLMISSIIGYTICQNSMDNAYRHYEWTMHDGVFGCGSMACTYCEGVEVEKYRYKGPYPFHYYCTISDTRMAFELCSVIFAFATGIFMLALIIPKVKKQK